MLYKNLPDDRLFSTLLIRRIFDGLAAVMFLMKGRFSYFRAVLKAHVSYYNSIGELKRKRELVKKLGTDQTEGLIMNKSIIFEFYIKGVKTYNRL